MELTMRTIALLLLFSCVPGCGAPPLDVPPAGTYLPELCAVVGVIGGGSIPDPPPAPAPTPGPAPAPISDKCENCNGTGKLGDGRVSVICPVCDGSGKVTREKAALNLIAFVQRYEATEKSVAELKERAVIGNKRLAELSAEVEALKAKPVEKPAEPLSVPSGTQATSLNWHQDLKPAREEATTDGRPMLVHWWAEWCGPCRNMQTKVFDNRSVIDELPGLAVLCKMTAAGQGEQASQTQRSWGVTAIPCDFVCSPDYKKKIKLELTIDPQKYLRSVKQAAKEVQAYIDGTKTDDTRPVVREVVIEPVYLRQPLPPYEYYQSPGFYGGGGGSCSGGSCSSGRCGGMGFW